MTRLLVKKSERESSHQFNLGHLWFDTQDGQTAATKEFGGFSLPASSNEWISYCIDRDYGPDRSIIALAPSSSSIVTSVQTTLNADLAGAGLTVELYASREEIRKVLESSSYEKDGNPGI